MNHKALGGGGYPYLRGLTTNFFFMCVFPYPNFLTWGKSGWVGGPGFRLFSGGHFWLDPFKRLTFRNVRMLHPFNFYIFFLIEIPIIIHWLVKNNFVFKFPNTLTKSQETEDNWLLLRVNRRRPFLRVNGGRPFLLDSAKISRVKVDSRANAVASLADLIFPRLI